MHPPIVNPEATTTHKKVIATSPIKAFLNVVFFLNFDFSNLFFFLLFCFISPSMFSHFLFSSYIFIFSRFFFISFHLLIYFLQRYPIPHTVSINSLSVNFSSFVLIFLMCSFTTLLSPSASYPHTVSYILSLSKI